MTLISIVFIVLGLLLFISKFFIRKKNNNYPQKRNRTLENFAVLIPARDESAVIEDLLISLENQSFEVKSKNIYVIVERIDDPTVAICKKHNANIIFRGNLNLKRKGYALKEAIEKIIKIKKYDAYFIFDADNILDKDFFKEMSKTYEEGYDMAIGYRNIKNKTNSIAISSGLIFTIINNLLNKNKSKHSLNCNASGTGFYISGDVINKLKTYPFTSLCEDYELSLYCTINNLTTYYNDKAVFYDEQPTNYKDYFNQRTRWVKGYFEARKKYIKELFSKLKFSNNNFASIYEAVIGIYDILLVLIGLILILINILLISHNLLTLIKNVLILMLIIYFLLTLFTYFLLKIEKKLEIDTKLKIKTMLINPLMLFTYLPCLIKTIIVRDITWNKIKHGK